MNIEQLLKHRCCIIYGNGDKQALVKRIIQTNPKYEMKLPSSFSPKKMGLIKLKNKKSIYNILEEDNAIKSMNNATDYLNKAISALELKVLVERSPQTLSYSQKERFGIIVDVANGKKDFLFYYEDIVHDVGQFMLCLKWILTVEKDARIIFVSNDTKKNLIQTLKNNDKDSVCTLYEYNNDKLTLKDISEFYLSEAEKNDMSDGVKIDFTFTDKTKLLEKDNTMEWMDKFFPRYDVEQLYMTDCDSYKYDMTNINDISDFIKSEYKEVTIYIRGKEAKKMLEYLRMNIYNRGVIDIYEYLNTKETMKQIMDENENVDNSKKTVLHNLPKEIKFDVSLFLNNHPDSREIVDVFKAYDLTSAEAINESKEKYSLLNKYRVLALFVSHKGNYQILIKGEDSIKAAKAFLDYLYQNKMISMFQYNKLTQDYQSVDVRCVTQDERSCNLVKVDTQETIHVHKDLFVFSEEELRKDKMYTALVYKGEPYQITLCENKTNVKNTEEITAVKKKEKTTLDKKIVEKEKPLSLTMNIVRKHGLSKWLIDFFLECDVEAVYVSDHNGKRYNLLDEKALLEYAETNNPDDVVTIAGKRQEEAFANFIYALFTKGAYSMLDYSKYIGAFKRLLEERKVEKEK